eukprot:jgi/Bigna1/145871/aug1.105_g20579
MQNVVDFLNGALGVPVMPQRRVVVPQEFRRQFKVYSVACANNYKPNMEEGDKILLPSSAFHELGRMHIQYPMMFQVRNPKNDMKTHCHFERDDNQKSKNRKINKCCLLMLLLLAGGSYGAYQMMNELCLNNGEIVEIKNATLKKGTYVKFQPHKTKLEKALRAYSCLTKGGTITIKHGQQQFYLDIVETKPGNAITIIDTDVNVDFAPPKDYKEEKKTKPSSKPQLGRAGRRGGRAACATGMGVLVI